MILKKFHSKILSIFKPLIYFVFTGILIAGGLSVIIFGSLMNDELYNRLFVNKKVVSLINNANPQLVDENNLWTKVNDWQKNQGYQPYVRSDFLCDIANKLIDSSTNWTNDYFKNNLKSYFDGPSYSWNFSIDKNSEDETLTYWTHDLTSKKNLTDYYYLSCIKCKENRCLQLFYNDPTMNMINNSGYPPPDSIEWGKAKQISEHTFAQYVKSDARMGTVEEIYTALNNYRNNHGKSSLAWNNDLATWATSRAQLFISNNNLDEHAGFRNEAPAKLNQLGFYVANEGSSLVGKLEAVHYIEWILAGDEPHKKTLLEDMWNTVGIGVASNDGITYGIDVIYAKTN